MSSCKTHYLRIHGLHESKLPGAVPPLDGLLSTDGCLHGCMNFESEQDMRTILLGKLFHEIVLVLPNALNQIGSCARVECSVSAAGENINAGLFHWRSLLDSGPRRNDGERRYDGAGDISRRLICSCDQPRALLCHGTHIFDHAFNLFLRNGFAVLFGEVLDQCVGGTG